MMSTQIPAPVCRRGVPLRDLAELPFVKLDERRVEGRPLPALSRSRAYTRLQPAGAACPSVRTAPFAPGTLQIFAGRTSLHRVSEVKGERLVAVYCFSDIEGFVNSPEVQRMFWGRAVRPD